MANSDTHPTRPLPLNAILRAAPWMAPGCFLTSFAAYGLVDDARGVILGCLASSLIVAGAAKALRHPDRSMVMLWVERGSTYVLAGISSFIISLPFLLFAALAQEWLDREVPAVAPVSGMILLALLPAPFVWRFWPALFLGFVADLSDGSYGVGKNRHVWTGPGNVAAFRATRIPAARPASRVAFVTVYLCAILWVVILELTPLGEGPSGLRLLGPFVLLPFLVAVLTHEADFIWRACKSHNRETQAAAQTDDAERRRKLPPPYKAPAQPAKHGNRPPIDAAPPQTDYPDDYNYVLQRCGKEELILYCAALSDDTKWNKILFRYGHHPDATDNDGATAIHIALRRGNEQVIRRLLELNAKVDIADNWNVQPMHMAALNPKSADFIPELIRRGASVDVLDNSERTPLHNAVSSSCLPAVRQLLNHGAETGVWDRGGDTSLHFAANWTPRASGDRLAQIRDQCKIIKLLIRSGLDINRANKRGETPLHLAARFSCESIIDELISHGATLNPQDKNRITPLQAAAAAGKPDNARALIRHKADLDIHTATAIGDLIFLQTHPSLVAAHKGDQGNSTLPSLVGLAVFFDQEATLDWLIREGANVNGSAFSPTPLLHAVCYKHDPALVRKLLKAGAKVDWPDGDGRTPLYYAASRGSFELVHVLMEFGADPYSTTERGAKPIDCTKDAKLVRLMKQGV